mgnify:CR=1 FL=1
MVLSQQPAFAHAQLTSSVPTQNQILKSWPKLVWIEFDGNLMTLGDKNPNEISVFNSKMKRVDIGGSMVGGARVSTRLKSGLQPGKYLVKYRIVSEDGHPVEGNFFFSYRP